MTVGDRIKIKREELNITQDELAKRMGYGGRSSISKVESSGDLISTKKIRAFSEALNVTPAYLMGWEEEAKKTIGELSPTLAEFSEDLKFKEALSNYVNMLNEKGKDRLLETLEEMSQLEKYTKE